MSAEQAALALAEEWGLPVFPCRATDELVSGKVCKAKTPYTQHGLKDASCNIEQITQWFTTWKQALVAVPTGKASKLFVVDIDPEGATWYRDNLDRLSCGRIHKTQRGHHLLYRMPDAEIRNSAGKIAPGIDVRAEGGYCVWWPAHGLEAIGSLEELTEPPAWLLQLLIDRAPAKSTTTAASWSEGRRNESLTREAGRLRRVGLSAEVIAAALMQINRERCSPPLEDGEVEGIARSVARYEPASEEHAEPVVLVPARSPLDWEALEGRAPPAREWALEHWLPQRHPALMAGRAGVGKTLLAQHVGTAMVVQHGYIDAITRPLKVLLWAGEDDEAELWRRQLPICDFFGVALPELKGKLVLQSYEGADITLAAPVFGTLTPTPMLAELTQQVHDYGAQYVFLDNIARIYGGNESDRHSVTQFLAWVSAACRPAGVCLLGHPAKGIGSEYSGSTAWEGAVRARLYLSDRLPDAQPADEEEEPEPGVRYLSRRKSNYSENDWRRLNYQDGALIPENTPPVSAGAIGGDFARDIVRRAVRKLQSMGFYGNASTRSPEYLPKLAQQYGLLDRLAEKRFGGLMREMLKDGELKVETVGQYSNRTAKPGLVLK